MKEGADGILLAPANSNSLVDSCEKVRKKKIPVVLIDSSINSTEFDVCYMTDNIDAGEMAAKEMLTMLHDTGNSPQESLEVGILLSSDASQAMVNRVSGFLDYWAKYAPTKWEITKDIALNGGDVKKAESDAAKLLKKNEIIRVASKYPNIAKDYFQFAEWEYIESELTRLLSELKSENFLTNLTKEKFAERLAYYWAELNVLHPFREGNGRTTREFLRQLALKNGYILNLHKISPQKLFNASIKSIIDTDDLEKYLYACLEK